MRVYVRLTNMDPVVKILICLHQNTTWFYLKQALSSPGKENRRANQLLKPLIPAETRSLLAIIMACGPIL